VQPPKPLEWTWIVQRHETDGQGTSVWKFGFIAPDGAEVRVTFHQVADAAAAQPAQPPQASQQPMAEDAAMGGGMPPAAPPAGDSSPGFAPAGQPTADQTDNSKYYVTFFSNRHPEMFMKWDTSLSHEDSLITWITITHGIIDFVRKAKPLNIILDDLANGKLKMVLRSVAMDIVAANPEYEVEQTQKHHYRSFYQIKRGGSQSAFDNTVAGAPQEGDTQPPSQASPVTGGQAQVQAQAKQQENEPPVGDEQDKTEDPTEKQPEPDLDAQRQAEEDKPPFASVDPMPVKQSPAQIKGLTVEIGKDYSVAVKDKSGNAIDRYRARNPLDIFRWIMKKGYGSSRMVIVEKEQLSKDDMNLAPESSVKQSDQVPQHSFPAGNSNTQYESFEVKDNVIRLKVSNIHASEAAMMNEVVNAVTVRRVDEGVEFVFETDRNMDFKKALVELAAKKIGLKI
jgi:hypothetical protein